MLVDGPSGAGKTSFSELLGELTGMRVVHLDDFYPGWSGLAEAARMVVDDVLDPHAPGYRRWDWETGSPAGWVPLDPADSLIVEGVGAVTAASIIAARTLGEVLTVRVDAPVATRRARALARDPGYRPWWDMWARQEAEHFAGPGKVAADVQLQW